MIEKLIDKFAHSFRIETNIVDNEEELSLVTKSYVGNRVIYSHSLDLLPLLDSFKNRIAESE